MTDSKQHPTTRSGLTTGGKFRSGSPPHNHSGWHVPEPVGYRWGLVELVSTQIERRDGYRYATVRCSSCQRVKMVAYDNLRAGKTRGCQACSRRCGAPAWLLARLEAAKQRCTNPQDPGFPRYGARGITFGFETVASAAVWVQKNLGLCRSKELDRIDNNRGYAPGNLRWASRRQNVANQGRSHSKRFHLFRQAFPQVLYADNTLRNLMSQGFTDEQIVERFQRPSCKPKGVYGTFSTPDPDIVSLSVTSS